MSAHAGAMNTRPRPAGSFHVTHTHTHTPNANDATTLTQDAEQVAN
jgi:hypothetical protein